MKKQFAVIICSTIISLSFFGCMNSSESKTEESLCFKNEDLFKDATNLKDVLELSISIDGENVTGIYNWLPAQKDQRKGHLTGTVQDNRIEATYIFSQEGIKDTAQLIITLNDNKAIVKGGNAALGLDASIMKVNCKSF